MYLWFRSLSWFRGSEIFYFVPASTAERLRRKTRLGFDSAPGTAPTVAPPPQRNLAWIRGRIRDVAQVEETEVIDSPFSPTGQTAHFL